MSVDERLARVEERIAEIQKDIGEIHEFLDGGPGLPWERSIRGRLHKLEGTLIVAHQVKNELVKIRDDAQQHRDHVWSRNDRILAAVIGVALAVGPWVSPLIYHTH